MIDTKKITEAAERHLEGTDMFVVECTSTPGNEIELTIDSDTSVGIDACVALSRADIAPWRPTSTAMRRTSR